VLAPLGVLAAILAGCTDAHVDRRQYISLATGDAVATNKVAHVINPWPPASYNRDIAYNGEKMQTAIERYRTGRIIAPVNATTSSVAYSQAAQAAQSASNTQASSGQQSGGGLGSK
jgi:hypothetical protein